MSLDLDFDEVAKTSDDYLTMLQDSLREKLKTGTPVKSKGVEIVSNYIRLTLKDLKALVLKHDDNGICMWNATPIKYYLRSKHMTAGVYRVWLEANVGYRTYNQALGKPLCQFSGYGNCFEFAKGGQFCEKHLEVKCRCGGQATHECTFMGVHFMCGQPLCNSCSCSH